MDTTGQICSGLEDKSRGLFAAECFAFSKLSDKALPGLLNEAQHRPVPFFATILGVVTFTATLLMTVQGFNGSVDIDTNSVIIETQLLPYPFAQDTHELQKGLGLVDAQAVEVAPESTRHRQLCQSEKSAQHGIKPDVGKMPDSVKAYKK